MGQCNCPDSTPGRCRGAVRLKYLWGGPAPWSWRPSASSAQSNQAQVRSPPSIGPSPVASNDFSGLEIALLLNIERIVLDFKKPGGFGRGRFFGCRRGLAVASSDGMEFIVGRFTRVRPRKSLHGRERRHGDLFIDLTDRQERRQGPRWLTTDAHPI
jgi:hypothetical protein